MVPPKILQVRTNLDDFLPPAITRFRRDLPCFSTFLIKVVKLWLTGFSQNCCKRYIEDVTAVRNCKKPTILTFKYRRKPSKATVKNIRALIGFGEAKPTKTDDFLCLNPLNRGAVWREIEAAFFSRFNKKSLCSKRSRTNQKKQKIKKRVCLLYVMSLLVGRL